MKKFHHYNRLILTMGKKNRNKSKILTQEQNRKLNIRQNEIRKNVEREVAERRAEMLLETKHIDDMKKSVAIFTNKYFTLEKGLVVDKKDTTSKKNRKLIENGKLMEFSGHYTKGVKTLMHRTRLRDASARFYDDTRLGFDFDVNEADTLSFHIRLQFYILMLIERPEWIIGEIRASCWMDISLDLSHLGLGTRRLIVSYFPLDVCPKLGKGLKNSIVFMDLYGDFNTVNMEANSLKSIFEDYKYDYLMPQMEQAGFPSSKSEIDRLTGISGFARDGILDNCIFNMINMQDFIHLTEQEHKKEKEEKVKSKATIKMLNRDCDLSLEEIVKETGVFMGIDPNDIEIEDVNDDSDEDYDTCDEYEELIVD